ncbi:hypothetical protein IJ182_10530 [bacterium]|nr:hypothetical protein [bacterium]
MNSLNVDSGSILNEQQKLVDLALIYWSLKKYSNKLINENNLEEKSRPLKSNLTKFENLLNSFNVKIIDYTDQKYNEGMNVDIIDTIKSDVAIPLIKETIEPSITINDILVKRARVIKEINRSENE